MSNTWICSVDRLSQKFDEITNLENKINNTPITDQYIPVSHEHNEAFLK